MKTELPFEIIDGFKLYNFKKSWYYLQELGKQKFGQKFKLHPEDKMIIYKLMIYFIRDEENCAKYGIDLEKGILLNGPVGCGKTSLMTLMRSFAYPDHNYIIKSTRDISSEFNQEGYPIIQKYGKGQDGVRRGGNKIYCFDDLGVENNMKYFGNECNTVAEILLQRYELQIMEGTVTHATTNLNSNELEELYGNRVRSRLRSMFNLIAFNQTISDKRS
ncbi:MAG: ATPase [Bacteroidetes bacterium]|nr:MAG: ATPase [Bacteroidota bacterium]